MELRHLHYFLAVAECASMTEAAAKIHVSQPALSNTVRELESELGFPLFERKGKRLVINESDDYLAQRARAIMGMVQEATQTSAEAFLKRQRTINCALNLPIGHALTPFLRPFFQAHPDITVRLGYEDSQLLRSSSVDMQIFGTPHRIEDDKNVVLLCKERFVAVLPSEHRLAKAPSLSLRDLNREPFIFPERSLMRDVVDSMFVEAGFEPHIICEAQLFSDALAYVEAGMGCCIAPEISWLGMEVCRYDISAKPIDDVKRCRYLYAKVNPESASLETTKMFVEELHAYTVEHRQPEAGR